MILTEILELVGTLGDTLGDNTPRERFRNHLTGSVTIGGAWHTYSFFPA